MGIMKIENALWEHERFDEQFYLTDLRREILWIIDHIIMMLDEKSRQLNTTHKEILEIDRPLEFIRIKKLKDDILQM